MDREEIRTKLKELLAVVDQEIGDKADTSDPIDIREGIGLDSLQIVELLFEIEESLDAKIEDEEAQNLRTVGELIDLIEKKTSAAE